MNSEQMLAAIQADYGTSRFNLNWQSQDWCYWDQVGISTAGVSELNFFAVAAGGNDPNLGVRKTTEQTNLTTSNQIGGAECFIVLSLHLDLVLSPRVRQVVSAVSTQTSFSADQLNYARWINAMVNQGVFVWEINKNTWQIITQPFRRMPPGFGLGTVLPPAIGDTDGTPAAINGGANAYAALSQYAQYGLGDIFSLDQPIFLAPTTPFDFTIEFPQANSTALTNMFNGAGTSHDQSATVWAYAEMRGVKVRPLQ